MKIINHTLPRGCNIFLVGDSHEGTVMRYDKGWDQFVDMVTSEYDGLKATRNFWIDHGDMIEAVMTDDPRYYDLTTRESSVIRQIDNAIKQRYGIRKKCLFILQGNHERKLHRYGDITEQVCKDLNVPYGTFSAIAVYKDKAGWLMFRHYASHGFGTIKSQAKDPDQELGNKLANLKMKMKWKVANALLCSMGHTHQLLINCPSPKLLIMEEGGEITAEYTSPRKTDGNIHGDFKWYVNSGSFVRTFGEGVSSYSEVAGYDPTDLGFAVVAIRKGVIERIDEIKLT